MLNLFRAALLGAFLVPTVALATGAACPCCEDAACCQGEEACEHDECECEHGADGATCEPGGDACEGCPACSPEE